MRSRTHAGNVISLTAVLVFTIFMIGSGLFLLYKILGASRELATAADAGSLNLAKMALTNPSVTIYPAPVDAKGKSLPTTCRDFFALADQPGSSSESLSLLTYNRMIGQAVLVATNAQTEGTPGALANANLVVQAAKATGSALQTAFTTQATINTLHNSFLGISDQNNLKMMGDQQVPNVLLNGADQTRLQTGYLNPGASANIWFDPSIISVPIAGVNPFQYWNIPLNKTGKISPRKAQNGDYISAFYQTPGGYNAQYIAGYSPIPVLQGTPFADSLWAVPNRPQQNPHLIAQNTFDASVVAPDPSAPQNCFRVDCKAMEKTSRGPLDTISCAIIGCTDSTFAVPSNNGIAPAMAMAGASNGTDYVASIPAGFIRIVNLPDMNTNISTYSLVLPKVTNTLYDGLNYIFNVKPKGSNGNYLAVDGGGGAYVSKKGFFVTYKDGGNSQLVMWANYVNSSGTDALGHDPKLDPNQGPGGIGLTPTYYSKNPNLTVFPIHYGSKPDELATLQQILKSPGLTTTAVPSQNYPLSTLTVDKAPLWVAQLLPDILGNFGSDIQTAVGAANAPTVIEYLKELIQQKLYDAVNHHSFHYTLDLSPNIVAHSITGLKYFKHYQKNGYQIRHASPNWWKSGGAPTASPTYPQFGNNSSNNPHSPLELLEEINATKHRTSNAVLSDPAYQNFLGLIVQRCKQMSPSITEADVITALASAPLSMGTTPTTLYLHLDLHSPQPKLVLTSNLLDNKSLPYDTGIGPDSWDPANPAIQYPSYTAEYDLAGSIVDTKIDGSSTAARADMNLEDQPYQHVQVIGKSFRAVDGAVFYSSTGYNNLLGEVHFYQQAANSTTVTFSMPN